MKELICIVCPRGCHLRIDENGTVTGNGCKRGVDYAHAELTAPVRTLTSTVKITGATLPRLPVKTDRPIPKNKIAEAMAVLNGVTVSAPVRLGQVIVENIADSGADLVATREM
ncbi:MAG: DUF1667 domain-containing protein [Clostridia bacterium]|jgi:CxxC motif-containing protein|nr:DUF1667 domain-containing protein [Clostridia bacterium]